MLYNITQQLIKTKWHTVNSNHKD